MPRRKSTRTVQVGLRVMEEMHRYLTESARDRDLSLNSEIVRRLNETVGTEESFGGPEMLAVTRAIADVMRAAGQRAAWLEGYLPGSSWLRSPFAYDQALKAAVAVLEALRPPGEISLPAPPPKPDPRPLSERGGLGDIGRLTAEIALGTYEVSPDPDRIAEARRALLALAKRSDKDQDK